MENVKRADKVTVFFLMIATCLIGCTNPPYSWVEPPDFAPPDLARPDAMQPDLAQLDVSALADLSGPLDLATPPDLPTMPSVILGHGATSFTAIADGDSVPMTYGPQGGAHLYGALAARNINPVRTQFQFTLTEINQTTVLANCSGIDLTLSAVGDHYEFTGCRVILPMPDIMIGKRFELHIQLTDGNAVVVSDSHWIFISQ